MVSYDIGCLITNEYAICLVFRSWQALWNRRQVH